MAEDFDPLPFERPDASQEVIVRANNGLACLQSLGVQGAALDALMMEIRRERTSTGRERHWPSLADDKAYLRRIHGLASELCSALEAMSMRVEIALNSEYHDANKATEEAARAEGEDIDLEDFDHARMQEQQLPALIEATKRVLDRMPYQSRPFPQVHLIEVVAKALKPLDIAPSQSKASTFHRACAAAFDIANVQIQAAGKSRPTNPSPTGSIRSFMKKRGLHSRWVW